MARDNRGQFFLSSEEDNERVPLHNCRDLSRSKLSRISCQPRHLAGVACVSLLGLVAAAALPGRHGQKRLKVGKGQGILLAEEGDCVDFWGVKLALDTTTTPSYWPTCTQKWSEDCTPSGCCQDAGMQCYEKNDGWAACKASCEKIDEKNETWTCKVLAAAESHNAENCKANCLKEQGCVQAVFDGNAGGSCYLSGARSTKVAWASDNFNTSLCGGGAEEAAKEVAPQLPFQMPAPPSQNCSWAGEDCAQTRCCNDVDCDKEFSNCVAYSCYRKDAYFSSCRVDKPPKEWDGTVLGGGRVHHEIGSGGQAVALHGTSLYCFAVVSWDVPAAKPFWSSEAELANNIKENGVSLMGCDAHDFYDGVPTPKAEWGSFSNIDAFQEIWKEVKAKGSWKEYDWTVKVDVDAVFIPARLKQHLDKLRVPEGSKVYLENIDYRFKFMGALEIVTREALEVFLEKGVTCIRGKHEGGEDFFMKGCMDGLGIDYMVDHQLLHDKYAANARTCLDGWAAAYHFHKRVISWNWCYNEVVCGNRDKTCPEGLPVPFVIPDGETGG
mmetsp:Transcript_45642/g.99738  ORF Transcript_45642/g.99738 Transcript_45642/m.99738 type:complete len:553 (-) Transcript_45642:152-1810(-)